MKCGLAATPQRSDCQFSLSNAPRRLAGQSKMTRQFIRNLQCDLFRQPGRGRGALLLSRRRKVSALIVPVGV